MKAAVWSGRNTVQVENVPDPKILNDRDAIVKSARPRSAARTCISTTAMSRR